MSTNLDEIVQQQQVKIHDLEKELEKALTEAPTPEAVYSLTAEKPVLNKFGTTWKPTFRSRQGEAFNRYMHRIDSAMAAFFEDKWQPANGGDSQTYTQTAPATQTTAPEPASEGSGMFVMHVQQFKITADTNGLPVLGFYQTGHKWPDLRYSLGKTMDERKANCAKLLSNVAGPVSPDTITIGTDKTVSWDVVWKPGRDPKYKDVVSVGPHINGKAA